MKCNGAVPRLIADLLPELRDGMSRDRLVREMARAGYDVSPGAIKAIESEPGRVPKARIIEGIAEVFGVPPTVFYEWPIAAMRDGRPVQPVLTFPDAGVADESAPSIRLTPLREAMRCGMAEQHVTFRRLAQITAENGVRQGRGLTNGYLGAVSREEERPSLDAIEAICEALSIDPNTITEYRLAMTRRLFDERPPPAGVGYDDALANLTAARDALDSLIASMDDEVPLPETGESRDDTGTS